MLMTLPIGPHRAGICSVPPLPIFYSQAPTAQLLQDPSEPALRVRLLRLDHFLHVVEPFLLQRQRATGEGVVGQSPLVGHGPP